MKTCRLGVKDGAITGITELYLPFYSAEIEVLKHPVLQRLVIRNEVNLERLQAILIKSPRLQLVAIPSQDQHVLLMVWFILVNWPRTRNGQVTLSEWSHCRFAPVVKLQVRRGHGRKNSPVAINILKWNYNNISRALENWDAHVLDLASQSLHSSLVSLTLDTSLLKKDGLASLHRVLRQSEINFLSIDCGAFEPSLANHLRHVLEAVNWPSLKSLTLSGNSIDAWIGLWAKCGNATKLAPFEVQLLRLCIVGFGGQEQRLTHSSALWLHAVIYWFSPVEVALNNIGIQEVGDWELIRGVISDLLPETSAPVDRNFG
ncbi:hypothetical protein BG000_004419 [Podila horticola]|nr:hypothetical protein BG000_004419 [Podila horticola]